MNFLGTVDWIFLILYMLVIAGISIWSIRKEKKSSTGYFLEPVWVIMKTSYPQEILKSN